MTQPDIRQWTVHEETGSCLGIFPHEVLADIFASTLADITQGTFTIKDSQSPAQKIVNFLKENKLEREENSDE